MTILQTRSPDNLPHPRTLSVDNPSTNRNRELACGELPPPSIVEVGGRPDAHKDFPSNGSGDRGGGSVTGLRPRRHWGASAGARRDLGSAPLIITEVAQSTVYGGTTADKVEVYCTTASGCAGFKVCDTAASGGSCSAMHPRWARSSAR